LASAPRPRASVVQNAETLSRKRQPKLTMTASTMLQPNSSHAPAEDGQRSPNASWPIRSVGKARNSTKYDARPRSRASQNATYENGLARSDTTSPVRMVNSTSHQPHMATIMINACVTHA
jgi:hypothetical protein